MNLHAKDKDIDEVTTTPVTNPLKRRYDVDWLRVIAIALLIIFHILLSFQPWAIWAGFPQNEQLLEKLGILMSILSVWRIPLLFLISGMGVRFAMERRNWKQLLLDRTVRILVPYIFGTFILGIIFYFALPKMGWKADYTINFGHLWFLCNIFCYVLWLIAFLVYLKNSPNNPIFRFLSKIISWPGGLFLFAIPLMIEAWLVDPEYFAVYVDTAHGWLMGLICFFMGFVFICTHEVFWPAVVRIRWLTLLIAILLFLVRIIVFNPDNELHWLTAFESLNWMLTILGFGSLYLNKPSHYLTYFSKAVYPVYIIHMPIQFLISYYLLPLELSAIWKLIVLLIGTFAVCLLMYEFILKRLKWIRPLFGIKLNPG